MNQVTTTTTNNTDTQEVQTNAVPVGGNAQLTAQNTEMSALPKSAENAVIVAPPHDSEQLPEQPADADEQLPEQPKKTDEPKKESPPPSTEPLVLTAKREHFATPHAVEITRDGDTITAVRLVNQQKKESIGATTLEAIVRANGGEIPANDTETLEIKFSPRTGTVMSISAIAAQA